MTERPAVVFGDVHGRADLLALLIGQIRSRFGSEVDIYSLGDLIDRGPNSRTVIDICIKEGVQAILGNHELWMHKYLVLGQFDDFALHRMMAGDKTLQSYGVTSRDPGEIERTLKGRMPREHIEYFLKMPVWRKVLASGRTFFLNHAGLKKKDAESHIGVALARVATGKSGLTVDEALLAEVGQKNPAAVLWEANSFKNPAFWQFENACQVLGHTPTPTADPILTQNWMALDTGCGTRRSVLTGVVLQTREVLQVNALTSGMGVHSNGYTDFSM